MSRLADERPDDEVTLGLPEPDFLSGQDSMFSPLEPLLADIAPPDPASARRADVDAKQEVLARILADLGCEGVVLLMPAHVAWFTGGLHVRGLTADAERPGVFTNGKQRWLLCSNVDTQRLFDEELDGLGFQLKEWSWTTGRAVLLGDLVAGKKVAADRPYPNMPLVNERLRSELRPLTALEQEQYRELGKRVSHALEATARNLSPGDTEQEVAGQVAHRLYRHGVEVAGVSVAADGRAGKFRRAGFSPAAVDRFCVLQATGTRHGLHVTCSRSVHFGQPPAELRAAFDLCVKQAAMCRAGSTVGGTVGAAGEAARALAANGPFEFDWRHSQPGYGAGRYAAEELRRQGADEPFAAGWPVVWQPRAGQAAIVDTVVVTNADPVAVTPPDGWPFKRVWVRQRPHDVPDLLVRTDG